MAIEPITRREMFMAKAGGQDVTTPTPITREEMFLSQIGGSGGSGSDYDVIIEATEDFYNSTTSVSIKTANIIRGNYADLKAKLEARKPISGYMYWKRIISNGTVSETACGLVSMASDMGDLVLMMPGFKTFTGATIQIALFANGTAELSVI